MAKSCPFCNFQMKDGARYCTGCGRLVEDQTGGDGITALTDLKSCFGDFPSDKPLECYLCADEEKCSTFTSVSLQADSEVRLASLENRLKAIEAAINRMEGNILNAMGQATARIVDELDTLSSALQESRS